MFLNSENMRRKIVEALKSANSAKLAVAYWGEGAVKNLGLEKFDTRDLRIVCNLLSGGTNPNVINELQKHAQVRHCTNLHAKVYLTGSAAIVSSSNASTNGLGSEGDNANQLIEAGVLAEDQTLLTVIDSWFEKVWEEAKEIKNVDLNEAKRSWEKTRNNRAWDRKTSKSQGPILFGHPLDELKDRNIFVTISNYERDLTQKAKKEKENYLQTAEFSENLSCYEVKTSNWRKLLPPTSYVIDCYVNPRTGKLEVHSKFFRVLENLEKQGCLVWGLDIEKARIAHAVELVMSPDDNAKIEEAIGRLPWVRAKKEFWKTIPITNLLLKA
ncbi:MAG: phospholipase D family protein [Pseudobdellovibrionaceae bacterium]